MRFGFITYDFAGHLNPMTALARQLVVRNHEVVFLFSAGAAGLPFVSVKEKDRRKQPGTSLLRRKRGIDAIQELLPHVLARSEMILKNLPKVVADAGVEALIIDETSFYAELGAIKLGIPYVQVAAAVHHDYSGYTPLCLYGWEHRTTRSAKLRNQEGVAKYLRLLNAANAGIKAYAKKVGLTINWDDPSSTHSPRAFITQVPKAFDFESTHWPPEFHHTGPFHDGKGRPAVDFPWRDLTGEPLVYASMGTMVNDRPDVFHAMVAIVGACANHKNLQLILSVGDNVDAQQIGSLPKSAIIVRYAPQLELLRKASVCITHAGLNTVLECLAQAVPQIAIPVMADQPGVAARIAHHRTGVVTSLDDSTPDRLSEMLSEVLTNPMYRENSRKMQKAITDASGLSVAADLVEQSLGVATKSG